MKHVIYIDTQRTCDGQDYTAGVSAETAQLTPLQRENLFHTYRQQIHTVL